MLILALASLTLALAATPAQAESDPCGRFTSLHVDVKEPAGAPIAGARLEAGPYSATTDRTGRARLCFDNGHRTVRVSHAGFRPASFEVRFGMDYVVDETVVLEPETLTSIGGTSSTYGYLRLNTGPGVVATLGRRQFDDHGSPQLAHELDQVPGVISNHTGSSNAASLGAQTSPNLRGSLDYEKTTLIDGHPVATGRFGDYVTTFLSPYVLQSVEIAKGPGAFAPLVVNGIGGSINFRTRDPPARGSAAAFDLVADGYGGSLVHALGATTAGKLGVLVDAVTYGTPGAFRALPTTVALPPGTQIAGVGTIGATTSGTPPAGTPAGPFPVANAQNNPSNAYVRVTACCQPVDSSFLGRSEVLKARWSFSGATSLTAAYIGNQSSFDLDAAQLQTLAARFVPSGAPVALNPATHLPANVTELENEPLFEAELRTTLRNETLIARWYTVSLNRFTGNAATSPAQSFTGVLNLTGSAPLNGGGTTPAFTGQAQTVTIPDVYSRTVEEDRVRGGSVAWLHPAGRYDYELALDRIVSLTNAYAVGASNGAAVFSTSVPAGSSQTITSLLARWTMHPNEVDALTLAGYATSYRNHFSTGPLGNGWTFGDATHTEIDPRIGFTHHDRYGHVVVRFTMGAAVTPPAFNVLSGVNQTSASVFRPGATALTITRNAGSLRPETSFGYDLGGDWRPSPERILSVDAYLTNVRDQLVTTVTPAGTFAPPGGGTPIPVYASAAANAGNSRFYGLEASLRSDRWTGFGYTVQGALTRAYAYAVSPSLYANASGALGTNLAIVPGANYTSTGTGFNGVSNKGIPYAQGYGDLHYRTERGGLALFGATYYGNNNSYGVRAFAVANASLRFPVGAPPRNPLRQNPSLQLSIDNVFNVHGDPSIATDAGIPVPLVNGNVGLVNALPVGPRTLRLAFHLGDTR